MIDSKFKYRNVFFITSASGRDRRTVEGFFAEHIGKEDFLIEVYPSIGLYHIYTLDDSWQVIAKLVDHADILKSLSRIEKRKEQ